MPHESKKWHYILPSAGAESREIWNSWHLLSQQKEDSAIVFQKFKDHIISTSNKRLMQLELAALVQKENGPVDNFECQLKAKAALYLFADDTKDDHLTFQLIEQIWSQGPWWKLIAKGNDLTFDAAVKCVQDLQAAKQNTSSFSQIRPQTIDAVHKEQVQVPKFQSNEALLCNL